MEAHTKLFLKELADLMEKHDAYFLVSDDWTGYPECGEDLQLNVEINNDYEEIKLGESVQPEDIRSRL